MEEYDGETIDIRTVDVIEFIIKRGREYPTVFFLFCYVRFINVLQLLRISEHQASISLFLTAFKFISIFCCISHNTGYVSLGADWFRTWYCASPALQSLYEKTILFRKTVNLRNIFSDRFMEWVIRNTRFYLRKFASGSANTHYNHVWSVALHLNNTLATNKVIIKVRIYNTTTKTEKQSS